MGNKTLEKTEKTDGKPVRVTLDLRQDVYERLSELESKVHLVGKANVIRQALQLYEHIVDLTRAGYRFRAISPEGEEQEVLLLGVPSRRKP